MSELKSEYLVGHVIDVLRSLPEKSVQCVATSPPYYGLRVYKGAEPVIWGASHDCQHEWGETYKIHNGGHGKSDLDFNIGRDRSGVNTARDFEGGQFCVKCNAWRGSLGLEPTPELYVQNIVEIFRDVRRVLRDDGTVWLNLGDSYAGSGKGGNNPEYQKRHTQFGQTVRKETLGPNLGVPDGLKNLDLIGIPWSVALALRADGWFLRMDNIWGKLATMPESQDGWKWVKCMRKKKGGERGKEEWRNGAMPERPQQDHDGKDFHQSAEYEPCPGCPKCSPNGGYILRRGSWRATRSHEYIFMLTKTDRYFSDSDAVREEAKAESYARYKYKFGGEKNITLKATDNPRAVVGMKGSAGRNLRSVLKFKMTPFKGSHYATFPLGIPTLAIKASTSEGGACPTCGAPYARVLNIVRPNWKDEGLTTEHEVGQRKIAMELYGEAGNQKTRSIADIFGRATKSGRETLGWKATCKCDVNGPPVAQTVLDPFVGAGTTLIAAMELGRNAIGIDISADYKKLAERRIEEWKAKQAAPKRQARPKKPKIIAMQKKLEDTRPEQEQAKLPEDKQC